MPIPPIRQKSAKGIPREDNPFGRRCVVCEASFMRLAPGLTGERGLWGGPTGWSWFCSAECADSIKG